MLIPLTVGLLVALVPPVTALSIVPLPPTGIAAAGDRPPDDTLLRSIDAAMREGLRASGARLVSDDAATRTSTPAVPAPVKAALGQAEAARRELDYPRAVQAYRAALDQMEATIADHGDVETMIDARLGLASIYIAGGETLLADEQFVRVLTLRPTLQLDLGEYPPQMAAAVERVRQDVAARPKAQLSVELLPDASDVVVDGVPVGLTPLKVDVSAGLHVVRVERKGFIADQRAVDAVAGSFVRVDGRLNERTDAALARQAAQALRAGEGGAGTRDVVRALVREKRADVALVLTVAKLKSGYAAVAVLTGDHQAGVAFTLGAGLAGLRATAQKAGAQLMTAYRSTSAQAPLRWMTTDGAPTRAAAEKEYSIARSEGVVWARARTPLIAGAPPQREGGALEAEDTGLTPYLFVGLGGAAVFVVVVAIAAGVGAAAGWYYYTLPGETVNQPGPIQGGDTVIYR